MDKPVYIYREEDSFACTSVHKVTKVIDLMSRDSNVSSASIELSKEEYKAFTDPKRVIRIP